MRESLTTNRYRGRLDSILDQERTSERLKGFLRKFGTLRIVDSGESTPDALFGKLNAVVVAMIQEGVTVCSYALSVCKVVIFSQHAVASAHAVPKR